MLFVFFMNLFSPLIVTPRYGKHGELLINYEETDEHLRRASVVVSSSKGLA